MALLRDVVLGTLRYGLTRRQQADSRTAMRQIRRFGLLPVGDEPVTYNLILAADDDRMDFAEELPEVLEALGVDVAAHAAEVRAVAAWLVAALLDQPQQHEARTIRLVFLCR